MSKPTTIKIDDVEYIRADSAPISQFTGNRAIVVIDRGWIMAGDVEETNGRIRLHRPVWVFRWEGIGLDGVIRDPKSNKVTLKKMPTPVVDLPADAEIFRLPVTADWGL